MHHLLTVLMFQSHLHILFYLFLTIQNNMKESILLNIARRIQHIQKSNTVTSVIDTYYQNMYSCRDLSIYISFAHHFSNISQPNISNWSRKLLKQFILYNSKMNIIIPKWSKKETKPNIYIFCEQQFLYNSKQWKNEKTKKKSLLLHCVLHLALLNWNKWANINGAFIIRILECHWIIIAFVFDHNRQKLGVLKLDKV